MNNFTKNINKNIIFNKNIKYEFKKNNIDYSILDELKYIDNSVINYIHKYIKYSYKIEYNNTTLILNSKSNHICKRFINSILNVIDNTRNLMNNTKHLNIILYLTDLKKDFQLEKILY